MDEVGEGRWIHAIAIEINVYDVIAPNCAALLRQLGDGVFDKDDVDRGILNTFGWRVGKEDLVPVATRTGLRDPTDEAGWVVWLQWGVDSVGEIDIYRHVPGGFSIAEIEPGVNVGASPTISDPNAPGKLCPLVGVQIPAAIATNSFLISDNTNREVPPVRATGEANGRTVSNQEGTERAG